MLQELLIKYGAVKRGDFTLTSGQKSEEPEATSEQGNCKHKESG